MKAPSDLGAAGRRLWREVTSGYVLDPAELVLLEAAARTSDELARVESDLLAGPVTVPGSKGQPVASPLLATVRAHRKVLESLLRSLALPLPGEVSGSVRSPHARDAARARWRREGLRQVRDADG